MRVSDLFLLILQQMRKKTQFNKRTLLHFFTFLMLIILLIIQVSWVFRVAYLEEQNFTYSVNMALHDAKLELRRRTPQCEEMSNFLCGLEDESHIRKYREVDSIIRANLNDYKIELPFTFKLSDSVMLYSRGRLFAPPSYTQDLRWPGVKGGYLIELEFPTRNQFLFTQLYGQLGLSLLFILFVMFLFLMTLRLYRKEKMLLLYTTDFINNMVHEFQTPIANIKFATSLIQKQEQDQQKTEEYTDIIKKESQRLQNHIEDILNIGCSYEQLKDDETINLHDLIKENIYSLRVRIIQAEASVNFSPQATNAIIKGEKSPVSLVIYNLLDNALKYRTQEPIIDITTYNKNGFLIVKIQDNGIGIKKDDQKRIFDKFFRVSTGNVHNVKGFGIGLHYARKVMHQCRGAIKLESTPDKGTTIIISFPTIK